MKEKREEESGGAALGVGALAGGAYAASKAKPLVTGRTTLYHGTSPDGKAQILREGLKPANVSGRKGGTDLTVNSVRNKAKELTYLTPDHGQARGYAGQAEFLHGGGSLQDQFGRMKAWTKGQFNPFQGGVVEAEMPMWRNDVSSRLRPNPETMGSYEAFRNEHSKLTKKDRLGLGRTADLIDAPVKSMYDELEKAKVFDGAIEPKYFRGSDKFQKLTLDELKEYAMTHPGRFAAGVGLGAAGVGAAGYGAKRLYDYYRAGKEVNAALDVSKLQGVRAPSPYEAEWDTPGGNKIRHRVSPAVVDHGATNNPAYYDELSKQIAERSARADQRAPNDINFDAGMNRVGNGLAGGMLGGLGGLALGSLAGRPGAGAALGGLAGGALGALAPVRRKDHMEYSMDHDDDRGVPGGAISHLYQESPEDRRLRDLQDELDYLHYNQNGGYYW